MKLSNNILFWVLQLFGWGVPSTLNAFGKYFNGTLKTDYIIAESILFIVSGITYSTCLRYYLKKNITFNKFSNREWLKIILSYLFFSSLFFGSLLLAKPLFEQFHDKEYNFTKIVYGVTLLNAFLYIFFWLLSYLSIKVNRSYRKNKIETLKLETELKASELNTLKGQINPHFMFNSLNNIRGLMLEDVEKSREMITRLSEMLRYSLTKNKIDTIALKEELEMVNNYIELSKIQFENRLQFSSQVDNKLLNIEIPPMIIQMLIENAIKHGISNIREGGSVILSIIEAQKKVIIKVSNSGALTENKSTTKVGIENIKKRLVLLYKDQASFTLKTENNLVIATIKLPL